MTLSHPHGQIYAYPYLPPRVEKILASVRRHREATGGDLFADVVAAERAGPRVVAANEHWTAFVPAAARWPYEVQFFPTAPGARPAGARPTPSATPSSRCTSTCWPGSPAGSTPRCPTSPPGTRRRSRDGPGRLVAAPAAVLAAARAREDEVPRRLGVGDGRVHHRHEPGGRRRAAARRGGRSERPERSTGRARRFAERFGAEPEGVWAAPGRVNVIGEHTDYNGGFVLPVAMPHTTRAAVARRDDGRVAFASLQGDGDGRRARPGRAGPRPPGRLGGLPGRRRRWACATGWPAA